MLETLFKFGGIQFAEGEIGLQAGFAALWWGGLVLAIIVFLVLRYRRMRAYATPRVRAVSLGLRLAALVLISLPLLEPTLITPDVVPDENFVAVLVDASESMSLPDGALGETRRDDASILLYDEQRGILNGIREDFKVRTYAFSKDAARTDSLNAVTYGHETNLSVGLDRVLSDFRGLPLTGVILITDGGDNSGQMPRSKVEELRSLGIGLHIIGLGDPEPERERELLDVVVTPGVGETAGAEIEIKVRSWADEAQPVSFNIYDGDRIVLTEERRLKGDGKIDQFAFFFEHEREGAHEYRMVVEGAPGERNLANNALHMLVDARKDTLRVLYYEGHLRQDFKFIKRALEDDTVVEFTSITRTGTGKLYRQGIRTTDELSGGFPVDAEDLYAFKAVIFGDVEASAFSLEQLRLVEQFVRVRGGGFLMMGGRQAFAEGDYMRTPIADLLPVELDAARSQVIPRRFKNPVRPSDEENGFAFTPTATGLESSILRFTPELAANRTRWAALPKLTSINYLGRVKPGAQVLAEKPDDQYGEREPLLIVQRYGKGRSMALATSSTWRWQMLRDADDTSHERFWQQLARWLAASAPNRVNITWGRGRFAPGDEIPIAVEVFDAGYRPQGEATVSGILTDPRGERREIHFDEALTTGGTYTATVLPGLEGIYSLDVFAQDEAGAIGQHQRSLLVRPERKEFYSATQNRTLLEELAAIGGRYYTADEAPAIADNLRNRRSSTSIFHAEYLWDMPLLFLLAVLLLCAEWAYRRKWGMP